MTETQERFLRNVLARVSVDTVVELHLFPPIRRGTMETGVAVIATVLPAAPLAVLGSSHQTSSDDSSHETSSGETSSHDASESVDASDGDDASPYAATPSVDASRVAPRLRILTAAYRHTIKGVDRGKWTVDVQEEADAPLEAVEAVLRGVRHRSSEPADPEMVSHDTLVALVAPARVAPAA